MQGNRVTFSVNIHGTLSADAQGQFTLPAPMALAEVSMCNSADSDMILTVGTSADADGIITAAIGGDSGTPAVIPPSSFDGDLADGVAAYQMANDTVIKWALDHDGDGGTASQNVMIVFTFYE